MDTSKKQSSYSKLKNEIVELKKDIMVLVGENGIEQEGVKFKWRMKKDLEGAIWFGEIKK